jgi:anti-anti-sigma factor
VPAIAGTVLSSPRFGMTSRSAVPVPPLSPLAPPPLASAVTVVAPGVVRVAAPRELLVGNRTAFKLALLDAFETAGVREVRVDLGTCGYIDASGLGILVSAQKHARMTNPNARIVFERANEDLVTLFQITKLDTLFEINPESNDEGVE